MDALLKDFLEVVDKVAAVAVAPGEAGFQVARVVAGLVVVGAGIAGASALLRSFFFGIEILLACAREIGEMGREFRAWLRRR